jgi:hypothetical protein
MDEYSQVGPEKGDFDGDCQRIAYALREGPVHVALTHRMTRQSLVLCLKNTMSLITGVEGCTQGEWIYVSRAESGAYWFQLGVVTDPSYIASKMEIHPVDAETVADFVHRISGFLGWPVVRKTSVVTQVQ